MAIEYENIPMALQFDEASSPLNLALVSIGWSDKAAEALNWIAVQAVDSEKKRKDDASLHLPFVTLWARFQLLQPNWISLFRDLAMKQIAKSPKPKGSVFGYIGTTGAVVEELNDIVARWLEGPLSHFVGKFGGCGHGLQVLRELVSSNQLLTSEPATVQLFPWGAMPSVGPNLFQVSAGEIARLLAGHELFPDLGPVMRIVDAPDSNVAELMTTPVSVGPDKFSLVCRISIQTLPGAGQPQIFLGFSRRRWANSLASNPFRGQRVGGYAFSRNGPANLAFRFELDFDYKKKTWLANQAYPEIELGLGLEMGFGNEKIVNYPHHGETNALVMHVAGIAEAKGTKLKAGVAVSDQLAAFRAILGILEPLGFKAFSDHTVVKRKAPKISRIEVLDSQAVLAKLLNITAVETDEEEEEDGAVLPQRVEQDLIALTRRSLTDWFGKKTPVLDGRYGDLSGVVSDLVRKSGISETQERRTLYVLVQTTSEIPWIEAVVRLMLGDAVDLQVGEIPVDVHGHSSQLPNANGDVKGRIAARSQAWTAFIQKNKFKPNPMFLIQADDWYMVGGKPMPDDSVNKQATRRVLAAELGATVQYLLPAKPQKLENYLMRLQAAILDLVYGHSGRILGLERAATTAFPDPTIRPKQVVAIGSIQVTMGSAMGTIVAATRVDNETGALQIRLAHKEAESIYTRWMAFEQALSYVAKRSMLKIPDRKDASAFYQKFVAEVLDEAVAMDPNTVVFIESTRSAGMWKRLADRSCQRGKLLLDSEQIQRPQWGNLRIVRVRELAPTMVNLRKFDHVLEDGEVLRVATSIQRLYEVSGGVVPTYWSFGPPIGHYKRGASCYRPMMLPENQHGAKVFPPDYGQHQTPRGTEFVVLQARDDDDPDRLASYCEMLRLGVPQARGDIWVKVPSPLYAIEKLEDYMRY